MKTTATRSRGRQADRAGRPSIQVIRFTQGEASAPGFPTAEAYEPHVPAPTPTPTPVAPRPESNAQAEGPTAEQGGTQPERAGTGSANLVMLWLLIPLIAILMYGLLDR